MTHDPDLYDEQHLRFLERKTIRNAEYAELRALAEQTALNTHPVVRYVLSLPVEDPRYPPVYPAILYHGLSDDTIDDGIVPDGRERQEGTNQERLQGTIQRTIQEIDQERDRKGSQETDQESPRNIHSPIRNNHIQWCMPGHDTDRPIEKGCGFIRASDDTMVYTACSGDRDHHCKAKKKHCWSLRCPRCMNDTALKRGIAVERQLLMFRRLSEKEGTDTGWISHWVVSPPQEFMKDSMQSFDTYDNVCRYIESQLTVCGATAGYTVFHPWRQTSDRWALSPHFHILLYGYIDTKRFLGNNPGWIIKKVHARQRIRSIRHTVAYLMTHMGIGTVVNEPEDVDWDFHVLDHFIPMSGNGKGYSDKDYEDLSEGRGRLVGDCSDMDWLEWTKQRLTRDLRVRYWGGVSYKNIVKIENYRQYKIRVCDECGAFLRTYDGFSDTEGAYVRYIQDNGIYSFARNRQRAKEFFTRYKTTLRGQDLTLADLAAMMPVAACTLELDVPRNNDIVMPGPFDEPDAYFEDRQRRAFGGEI